MEFIMDMVHHNPGEAPFETAFLDPEKLREFGYNAQVFKHINTAVTFSDYDPEIFPAGSESRQWMDSFGAGIAAEIARAKAAGLKVYYHIDLFVLPKALVEKYGADLCDGNGKISLRREKTLEVHRALFDEMFRRFPDVDGLIIRVGETYLHDTPYHTGNGAVLYGDKEQEKRDFAFLLNFLREEVCVRHGRYLFFRTWDCFPDRFHADPDYYQTVCAQVEPHEKLLFSIKHTALDFWRRVKFNECITLGAHRQIIEVQCQREYEGKGAYPMYVMNGVINTFEEYASPRGLRDVVGNPLVCGIYTWTRGGGWEGPYLKNEFWCGLNAYVIAQYAKDPSRTEEEIFNAYTREQMGLSAADAEKFRRLCLTACRAELLGRYIKDYDDKHLHQAVVPCGNWIRDDKLGGLDQLGEVFAALYSDGTLRDALAEKRQALALWEEVREIYRSMEFRDTELGAYIGVSVDYAVELFRIICHGWGVMVEGYLGDRSGSYDREALREQIRAYDAAWGADRQVGERKDCASLFRDTYFGEPGLGATVDRYRDKV